MTHPKEDTDSGRGLKIGSLNKCDSKVFRWLVSNPKGWVRVQGYLQRQVPKEEII